MCGRFTLRSAPKDVAKAFGLSDVPLFQPRYSVAPTQTVAAIQLVDGKPQQWAPSSARQFADESTPRSDLCSSPQPRPPCCQLRTSRGMTYQAGWPSGSKPAVTIPARAASSAFPAGRFGWAVSGNASMAKGTNSKSSSPSDRRRNRSQAQPAANDAGARVATLPDLLAALGLSGEQLREHMAAQFSADVRALIAEANNVSAAADLEGNADRRSMATSHSVGLNAALQGGLEYLWDQASAFLEAEKLYHRACLAKQADCPALWAQAAAAVDRVRTDLNNLALEIYRAQSHQAHSELQKRLEVWTSAAGDEHRWLTVTEADKVSDFGKGNISRWADEGVLDSNGMKGRARRIDLFSLARLCVERSGQKRPPDDRD